ncbi:hypothetical protein D3C72_1556570 [compost metagenome]
MQARDRPFGNGAQLLMRARHLAQHPDRQLADRITGRRQLQPAAAHDQPRPGKFFHFAKPVRHRRLRHVQPLRGGGQRPGVQQDQEGFEVPHAQPARPGHTIRRFSHERLLIHPSEQFTGAHGKPIQ